MESIQRDKGGNSADCMLDLVIKWASNQEGTGTLPRTWQTVSCTRPSMQTWRASATPVVTIIVSYETDDKCSVKFTCHCLHALNNAPLPILYMSIQPHSLVGGKR